LYEKFRPEFFWNFFPQNPKKTKLEEFLVRGEWICPPDHPINSSIEILDKPLTLIIPGRQHNEHFLSKFAPTTV